VGTTGNPLLDGILLWGSVAVALTGIVTVLWRVVRTAVKLARRLEQVADDFFGEEGRPGVPARPGLLERVTGMEDRLLRVEHEMHPNDGGSLRDAVDMANRQLWRLCRGTDGQDDDEDDQTTED